MASYKEMCAAAAVKDTRFNFSTTDVFSIQSSFSRVSRFKNEEIKEYSESL